MFSRRWWWTTLLVIAGIALTVSLGLWQVGRYKKNKAFEDHLVAMQKASPLFISGVNGSEKLLVMEYRSVQASGTFDYSSQIAVRNQFWTRAWGQDVGFILLTPFILPDGSAVLVNRGWIPLADNTPESWQKYDGKRGETVIKGIIRLTTSPTIKVVEPTLAPWDDRLAIWKIVDLPNLQKQLPYPILPIYIQQAPDPEFAGMPYRTLPQPDPSASEINASFASVWFLFSLLLIFGYPLYLRKQPEA